MYLIELKSLFFQLTINRYPSPETNSNLDYLKKYLSKMFFSKDFLTLKIFLCLIH